MNKIEICQAKGELGEACRFQREKTGDADFCGIADNDPLAGIRESAKTDGVDLAIKHCLSKIKAFKEDSR